MAQLVHVELGRMGFPAAQHAVLCKQFGGHERARDLKLMEVDNVLAKAEQLAADAGRKVGRKWRDRNGRSRLEWRIREAIRAHGLGWVAAIVNRVCGWSPAGFWEIQEQCELDELHHIVAAIERTEGWSHR